jgi:hypothetical protein
MDPIWNLPVGLAAWGWFWTLERAWELVCGRADQEPGCPSHLGDLRTTETINR